MNNELQQTADEVVMTSKEIIARVEELRNRCGTLCCHWANVSQFGRHGKAAAARVWQQAGEIERQWKALRATYP